MWVRFPPPALGLPLGEFDGLATYVYLKSKRTHNAWAGTRKSVPAATAITMPNVPSRLTIIPTPGGGVLTLWLAYILSGAHSVCESQSRFEKRATSLRWGWASRRGRVAGVL